MLNFANVTTSTPSRKTRSRIRATVCFIRVTSRFGGQPMRSATGAIKSGSKYEYIERLGGIKENSRSFNVSRQVVATAAATGTRQPGSALRGGVPAGYDFLACSWRPCGISSHGTRPSGVASPFRSVRGAVRRWGTRSIQVCRRVMNHEGTPPRFVTNSGAEYFQTRRRQKRCVSCNR
jgi:hypothetical protein